MDPARAKGNIMRAGVYSEDFKQQAVAKFINRGNKTTREVADELNTSDKNIYRWLKEINGSTDMKKKNHKSKRQNFSAEEKFTHLLKTFEMNEPELGKYLRAHGLHSADLVEWKAECVSGVKSSGRPKKDPEVFELRKKEKSLKKDLQRKEKALAEMSARVILLKKSHEIFGGTEDDE